jgi:hypothetical protein
MYKRRVERVLHTEMSSCMGCGTGQQSCGKFLTLAINGPDDTSTSRWIPTTACDHYFATLASWFGVDAGNLSSVFPNLSRFATPDPGFL